MGSMRLAVLLILLPALGFAKAWTIDPTSMLTFTASQAGKPFTGRFPDFTAQVVLDPAHPESGNIKVEVDMRSASAGSSERTQALPKREWFDVGNFPMATFESKKISKTAQGYVAEGMLTLKGIIKPLVLTFTLTPEGANMRAKGSADIKRNEFKVGIGEWDSEEWIPYNVRVEFDLLAR